MVLDAELYHQGTLIVAACNATLIHLIDSLFFFSASLVKRLKGTDLVKRSHILAKISSNIQPYIGTQRNKSDQTNFTLDGSLGTLIHSLLLHSQYCWERCSNDPAIDPTSQNKGIVWHVHSTFLNASSCAQLRK